MDVWNEEQEVETTSPQLSKLISDFREHTRIQLKLLTQECFSKENGKSDQTSFDIITLFKTLNPCEQEVKEELTKCLSTKSSEQSCLRYFEIAKNIQNMSKSLENSKSLNVKSNLNSTPLILERDNSLDKIWNEKISIKNLDKQKSAFLILLRALVRKQVKTYYDWCLSITGAGATEQSIQASFLVSISSRCKVNLEKEIRRCRKSDRALACEHHSEIEKTNKEILVIQKQIQDLGI